MSDKLPKSGVDVRQYAVPALQYSPEEAVLVELVLRNEAGRTFRFSDRMSRYEAETWMEFFRDLRSLAFELENSDGDVSKLRRLYRRYKSEIAGKWPMT
jgi:hypothetical protein